MPTSRLNEFSSNIQISRDLVGLGQAIAGMTHGIVDATDLYRASLVNSVSALDRYMHGVVLDRGVEIILGNLGPFTASTKVGLTLGHVNRIVSATSEADRQLAAIQVVAERLAKETFQKADDVASALASVGISAIWKTAFDTKANQAKTALNVVVNRRNSIVHACDLDPAVVGSRLGLTDVDALDAASVIELVVTFVDPHC